MPFTVALLTLPLFSGNHFSSLSTLPLPSRYTFGEGREEGRCQTAGDPGSSTGSEQGRQNWAFKQGKMRNAGRAICPWEDR
eukprot:gene15736-biopygen8190